MFSTERGLFDVNLTMKLAASLVSLDLLRRARPLVHEVLYPVADMSFGIFFLHYYFIVFAKDLRVELGGAPWAGSILNLFIYTMVLTILSMIVVRLLRAMLGKSSRYLVGS
jgi:peptidoglycan/LPS O-acetylase OafA/YrhL